MNHTEKSQFLKSLDELHLNHFVGIIETRQAGCDYQQAGYNSIYYRVKTTEYTSAF